MVRKRAIDGERGDRRRKRVDGDRLGKGAREDS